LDIISTQRSSKLDKLQELVCPGSIIFTQYIETVNSIVTDITTNSNSKHLCVEKLVGSQSQLIRSQIIERFQNNEIDVLVISILANGVGINLVRSHRVILFDLWWNPAIMNQAIDRVHRLGQKNQVEIHWFVTKDTIEEHIHKMLKAKSSIADEISETSVQWLSRMSKKELFELLSIKK